MEKRALTTSTPRSPAGIVCSTSHAIRKLARSRVLANTLKFACIVGVQLVQKKKLRWTRRPPVVWAPILHILLMRSNYARGVTFVSESRGTPKLTCATDQFSHELEPVVIIKIISMISLPKVLNVLNLGGGNE
jgi:hypothetical protein